MAGPQDPSSAVHFRTIAVMVDAKRRVNTALNSGPPLQVLGAVDTRKETFKTYDKSAQTRCQPSGRAQISHTLAPQRLSGL